jgi:hypothetical protein
MKIKIKNIMDISQIQVKSVKAHNKTGKPLLRVQQGYISRDL